MKYIILDAPGGEAPVVFPRQFMHSYMASLFKGMAVVGAGFVSVEGDGPRCFGTSSSLRIDSRGDTDTILVARYLAAP